MPDEERDAERQSGAARTRVERMIERHLARARYVLNPDPVTVEHVKAGLTRNLLQHGRWYCPCREVTGDVARDRKNTCPCPQHHQDVARDGVCECGIFVSREFAAAHSAGISRAKKEA
jgi:ferredoxin-thioredoxin reductase catalytic subunit